MESVRMSADDCSRVLELLTSWEGKRPINLGL
jgi:hypothetical protein